ncbi:hypothetical protein Tco_0582095 [Tanacetum coccineum]
MPPLRRHGALRPRGSRRAAMERIIADRVAQAIEDHDKKRASSSNTEGSSSSGGCSHKTFMSGKPHSFNGTEGVVGLTRWMEKMEQVFGTCKCAEQDKSGVCKPAHSRVVPHLVNGEHTNTKNGTGNYGPDLEGWMTERPTSPFS